MLLFSENVVLKIKMLNLKQIFCKKKKKGNLEKPQWLYTLFSQIKII